MKQKTVLVLVACAVCGTAIGILLATDTDDGFFKGDYFGVTWGMTPDEVFNAFTEKKISGENGLEEFGALGIEHILFGYKVSSSFGFNSALRLEHTYFKLKAKLEDVKENTGTLADFVGKYTNQLVKKYGKASKVPERKIQDNINYERLTWDMPKTYIIIVSGLRFGFEGHIEISHMSKDSEYYEEIMGYL